MRIHSDVLIIGSGIAGLSIAIKIADKQPDRKITIVTKSNKSESNTKYAQGGVAAVFGKGDSFEKHIKDTLEAGAYLNNKDIVEKVVRDAPERINEIVDWGMSFDISKNGKFQLGKEGGHSDNRIIHKKDATGKEIEFALIKKIETLSNVALLQHLFVVDLITNHHLKLEKGKHICYGAYVLDEQTMEINTFTASKICLAMGGIGQVYKHTTNPLIATGDGIAIAYRAWAKVAGMEFIQFHPTSLYNPSETPSFLISEAVRGFGALLKNQKGKRFILDYDDRGELASRDIVSRAIDLELKKTGETNVYLDLRHKNALEFQKLFPNINKKCKCIGIDISKEMIPVVPAMHYVCGGVDVDKKGRTSIKNLYACGECSHTGLHGANRLASNSLLEALVFSHDISNHIAKQTDFQEIKNIPEWSEKGITLPSEKIMIRQNKEEIQNLMSNYVAIVRSNERLEQASKRLEVIYKEIEVFYQRSKLSTQLGELRNLVTIAYIIVSQSIERKENKGAFYNRDLV